METARYLAGRRGGRDATVHRASVLHARRDRTAPKTPKPHPNDLAPGTRGETGVGYFPVDESIGRPGCGGVGVVGSASARSDRQPGPSRAGASESKAATFKEGSSSVPGSRASCVGAGLDDPPRYISNGLVVHGVVLQSLVAPRPSGNRTAWPRFGTTGNANTMAARTFDGPSEHHGCAPDIPRTGPSGPSGLAQLTL